MLIIRYIVILLLLTCVIHLQNQRPKNYIVFQTFRASSNNTQDTVTSIKISCPRQLCATCNSNSRAEARVALHGRIYSTKH